jgi:hypothetical protein
MEEKDFRHGYDTILYGHTEFVEFIKKASIYKSKESHEGLRTFWAHYHSSDIEFRFVCHEDILRDIVKEASNRNGSLTSLYFDFAHDQILKYIERYKKELLRQILIHAEVYVTPTLILTVDNTMEVTFPPIILVS